MSVCQVFPCAPRGQRIIATSAEGLRDLDLREPLRGLVPPDDLNLIVNGHKGGTP